LASSLSAPFVAFLALNGFCVTFVVFRWECDELEADILPLSPVLKRNGKEASLKGFF
jgi:hypothetical protein